MFSSNITKKLNLQNLISVRNYASGRLQVHSSIPSRPMKKIRVGKARPAIYYKFNTHIELSDGSVIYRKSQYPKEEMRMITDQRNNHLWNQSKPDVSLLDAEAKGKLNKFKTKFAAFDQSGLTESEIEEQRVKEENERKERLETGSVKKSDEESDDYLDILSGSYVEEKLGGNIAKKEKGKKKK
ncbi:hypothetical protein B5S28_g2463 [[Candida] boidinii]|nr:hypothetical protein B5S28_g2463 [[Candida] boidinii]OWB64481.1 hypothetical protein B5S29_g5597 [[Candida] boidinii]OWB73264.1 hypothetical protein B5S31_g2998 [[Candida] boidinii]OWB76675.1 hypothetical protein B5S32_g830 [[Candida] boidinii]GME99976.1 unnamed protein product [[Candida] boidinii]